VGVDEVVPVPPEHLVGLLVYHEHEVRSDGAGGLVALLGERDLGSLLPAWLDVDGKDFLNRECPPAGASQDQTGSRARDSDLSRRLPAPGSRPEIVLNCGERLRSSLGRDSALLPCATCFVCDKVPTSDQGHARLGTAPWALSHSPAGVGDLARDLHLARVPRVELLQRAAAACSPPPAAS